MVLERRNRSVQTVLQDPAAIFHQWGHQRGRFIVVVGPLAPVHVSHQDSKAHLSQFFGTFAFKRAGAFPSMAYHHAGVGRRKFFFTFSNFGQRQQTTGGGPGALVFKIVGTHDIDPMWEWWIDRWGSGLPAPGARPPVSRRQ